MRPNYTRPIQILGFLALVLLFCNFQFSDRFGTRGARWISGEPVLSEIATVKTTKIIPLRGYLSSKLATTARLANHIWELVSIYGMSKRLHRKPAIFIEDPKYQRLVDGIKKILPGLLAKFTIFKTSVPPNATRFLLSDDCCKYDNPSKLEDITAEYLHLTGHFYQSWRYFNEFQAEVLDFVKPAENWRPLPVSDEKTFITCIHIRRADFIDGQHHSSERNFTVAALKFIEETEGKKTSRKLKTVIMGDDAVFEEALFPNTIRARKGATVTDTTNAFVSDNTPQNDLAYSRYHCDASLITAPSSTFGWWIGYLSKGQHVFYQDIRSTNDVNYKKGLDPNDFFPPEWIPLNLEPNGSISVIKS